MSLKEINEKIAEMKGYKEVHAKERHYPEVRQWKDPNGYAVYENDWDFEIPHWAENISDAWDLFEEMPDETSIQKEDGIWTVHLTTRDNGVGVCINGESGPLAISLAWIKWKENS